MPKKQSLYIQVVSITADYLGPSAERFVDRQIANHLGKPPAEMSKSDLSSLIDWLRAVTALLTEDKNIVDEYIGRLYTLVANKKA